MKLLVTGCAGFIGANFVKYILENHHDDKVIGVDCLTYAANLDALEELKSLSFLGVREKRVGNGRFSYYRENICDANMMHRVFELEHPDVIVNFAAETHVDRSISDSEPFVRTNVEGVRVLLKLAREFGTRRFHQVSTDEVYGDMPTDSQARFDESSPLCPSSPYSATKAAAELLALSYHRTHGVEVSISRSSNNYGKYQHAEKLIPTVIRHALANSQIPIYGDGSNTRDWIFVLDNCRAIDQIIRHAPSGNGKIYNIATGTSVQNLELVYTILDILGKPHSLVSLVSDRKGHDRSYPVDPTLAFRVLGWRATASVISTFSTELVETVRWYERLYSTR